MTTIRLDRTWHLGPQLGKGGYGRVYLARSDDGAEAVVKLIPKEPGAKRELLFESLTGVPSIIPVIDTGEHKNNWALVMPRAEKSLREHLANYGGSLAADEAVAILTEIATALARLEADVVHRDLKPDNVLLYQGHWCLADFGIARYVEASTSLDTRKWAMTYAYAVPERWRGERATSASDVYSLGVMAFEVLLGRRPFLGPAEHDFRDQHLHGDVPPMPNCPPSLVSLVSECLYKSPEARPTAQNLQLRLQSIMQSGSPERERLRHAQQVAVEKKTRAEVQVSAARSEAERREALWQAAHQSLQKVMGALATEIASAAPAAGQEWPFQLDDAALTFEPPKQAEPGALAEKSRDSPFDVIAYTHISLRVPPDRSGWAGRSHSLWFCDAQAPGVYRWYETAFMLLGGIPYSHADYPQYPFHTRPNSSVAREAVGPGTGYTRVAWPFTPIDQGEVEFTNRWVGWFADAALGQLRQPQRLPERDPKGSWRQP